jgi:hypothetical protein
VHIAFRKNKQKQILFIVTNTIVYWSFCTILIETSAAHRRALRLSLGQHQSGQWLRTGIKRATRDVVRTSAIDIHTTNNSNIKWYKFKFVPVTSSLTIYARPVRDSELETCPAPPDHQPVNYCDRKCCAKRKGEMWRFLICLECRTKER